MRVNSNSMFDMSYKNISPLLLNDGLDKINCTGGRVRFNADALKAFDG